MGDFVGIKGVSVYNVFMEGFKGEELNLLQNESSERTADLVPQNKEKLRQERIAEGWKTLTMILEGFGLPTFSRRKVIKELAQSLSKDNPEEWVEVHYGLEYYHPKLVEKIAKAFTDLEKQYTSKLKRPLDQCKDFIEAAIEGEGIDENKIEASFKRLNPTEKRNFIGWFHGRIKTPKERFALPNNLPEVEALYDKLEALAKEI